MRLFVFKLNFCYFNSSLAKTLLIPVVVVGEVVVVVVVVVAAEVSFARLWWTNRCPLVRFFPKLLWKVIKTFDTCVWESLWYSLSEEFSGKVSWNQIILYGTTLFSTVRSSTTDLQNKNNQFHFFLFFSCCEVALWAIANYMYKRVKI